MVCRSIVALGVFACPCAAQWIEPKPAHTELGAGVRIEAYLADGRPLPGLEVRLVDAAGDARVLGVTDEHGVLPFVADKIGSMRLVAEHAGVDLLAPFRVRDPAPRIWLAILGTPLGLWILWRALSAQRSERSVHSQSERSVN